MIPTNMNLEIKNPITYKQETIQPKKFQIKLIKKKLDLMFTLIKKPKLLDKRPQLFDYKEPRSGSIRKNATKTVNI
jgi:hypothetical protein